MSSETETVSGEGAARDFEETCFELRRNLRESDRMHEELRAKLRDAEARAESYSEVLRILASALGAGGFNAPDPIDAREYESKIRWGIDEAVRIERERASKRVDIRETSDMLEAAWGVIANAMDWDDGTRAEWRGAAERWRDRYHAWLLANWKRDAKPAARDAFATVRELSSRSGEPVEPAADPLAPRTYGHGCMSLDHAVELTSPRDRVAGWDNEFVHDLAIRACELQDALIDERIARQEDAAMHDAERAAHKQTKADRDGWKRAAESWKRAAESQNRQWSMKCEQLTEERAAHEQTRAEFAAYRTPELATLSVREAARRRSPLGGTDAQALEGAITLAERERDAARAELAEWLKLGELADPQPKDPNWRVTPQHIRSWLTNYEGRYERMCAELVRMDAIARQHGRDLTATQADAHEERTKHNMTRAELAKLRDGVRVAAEHPHWAEAREMLRALLGEGG